MGGKVAADIRKIFTAPDGVEADQKRMRTFNSIECLNKEIKRRTRVATLFPTEKSLLRLVSAVLSEISEEWETGKV